MSCVAAYYLAVTTAVSFTFGFGLGGFATAWVITCTLGIVAVKRRQFLQHQEWMIRSYVVTFAFVVFRMVMVFLTSLNVGTLVDRLNVASWFCWAVPLLVCEAVIQGRKVRPGGGVTSVEWFPETSRIGHLGGGASPRLEGFFGRRGRVSPRTSVDTGVVGERARRLRSSGWRGSRASPEFFAGHSACRTSEDGMDQRAHRKVTHQGHAVIDGRVTGSLRVTSDGERSL